MGVGLDMSFASTWRSDARAGLVVFLVALPLCLGIALASGAPLMSGVITGAIGGLVVSRLSGSQLMVSGPAAGLTAIVATAIITLGSFTTFLTALVIAGALQLLMWRARAGVIAYFFPSSVIKGMLAAIGITLILKQLPYALGAVIPMGDAEGAPASTLAAIATAAQHVNVAAVIITLLGLGALLLWNLPAFRSVQQILPAPLAVVIVGVVASLLFATFAPSLALPAGALVSLPIDDVSGIFALPDWSQIANRQVLEVAVTVALVATLETLLSLEATDKLDPFKRRSGADRELMAQGVGNMMAGLIGGLPMTGVIVRSAANADAGGKTWRASFFHGVFLTVAVVTLAGVLNYIPLAALAAILLHVGYKLAKPTAMLAVARMGPQYYVPCFATIAAILVTDLLKGIIVGLAIGMFFVLLKNYSNAYFARREESDDHHRVSLLLAEEVSFLNKASIAKALDELPSGCVATVDGNHCRYIDPDVVELLHEFSARATLQGVRFHLVGVPESSLTLAQH